MDMELKSEQVQHLNLKKAKRQAVSLVNAVHYAQTTPTSKEPRGLLENISLYSSHSSAGQERVVPRVNDVNVTMAAHQYQLQPGQAGNLYNLLMVAT
ncbi:hypothetical protein PC129_g14718 [Phytophthora cactorum]|nr:hypothetical protein PC129_g14718 [Phytophthora cactorum]